MTRHDRPHSTRLYRNGASQAVRIPEALAFPEDIEVELVRHGDEVVVRPVARGLAGLRDALRMMGAGRDGFERDAGGADERDRSGNAGR